MRFKGTLILLLVCIGVGCFIYFYEIKGGEEREKARESENRFWMTEGKDIQQIELSPKGEKIAAARKNEKEWIIQLPRLLEADSAELDRLADRAAEMKFESILEESGADPAKFGLEPAQSGVKIKTAAGEEYEIFFGDRNPSGDRNYAKVSNRGEIFLVASSLSGAFEKKLDDLRNRSILRFEQPEVRTLAVKNPKDDIRLVKDGDDRWWIEGEGRIAADSPAIRGILNALSLEKIPEFFDEDPGDYANASLDEPFIDVSLTYGEDKALKKLRIGSNKAGLRKRSGEEKPPDAGASSADTLYLAKDESRPELFFVGQDLVDKLNKSADELRDKALAAFQRWDVDSIILENPNGNFAFTKESGEWFLGDAKNKADFDAVNGILDALESDALELIDKPGSLSSYGLDKPAVRVVLKQKDRVVADCSLGRTTEKGVYARIQADPAVKVMGPESYEKLTKNEEDFIENPEPADTETTDDM
ncbi:MAG: DUF4340 domain-containing protein [Acidobacteria bacterium]|nr:DUF4340 domain-containing protein [Acidobacteriota bacterium]